MTARHTPGPWRVEEGTTLVWGACDPDDRSTYGMGYPVAMMERSRRWDCGGRPSIDEQVANAHLIAAAPELLAELKAALGYMMNARIDLETGCPKATTIKTISGGIERIREAIAKATA